MKGAIRLLSLVVAFAGGLAPNAGAQAVSPLRAGDSGATFEVASVKPHVDGAAMPSGTFRTLPGGRFEASNITVALLLAQTYRIQLSQVVGGPDWIRTRRFDFAAKAPETAGVEKLQEMVRALLSDRFHFVAHSETRSQPVLALVVAGGGATPGLRRAECRPGPAPASPDGKELPPCRSSGGMGPGRVRFTAGGIASMLIPHLTREAQQLVVDRTGLEGLYDVDLRWSSGAEGPSLFTAVQEQLGLKLVPRNEPIDVLVVDRLEEPTPN